MAGVNVKLRKTDLADNRDAVMMAAMHSCMQEVMSDGEPMMMSQHISATLIRWGHSRLLIWAHLHSSPVIARRLKPRQGMSPNTYQQIAATLCCPGAPTMMPRPQAGKHFRGTAKLDTKQMWSSCRLHMAVQRMYTADQNGSHMYKTLPW